MVSPASAAGPLTRRSADSLLTQARSRLDRLSPREAYEAQRAGAVLVDIRPDLSRELEGGIPDALVVHRNVLEWRFDPSSDARIEQASYDLQVVIVCAEGTTSSLAAASLLYIGLARATDVVGGFRAWRAAGLPVHPPAIEVSADPPVRSGDSARYAHRRAPSRPARTARSGGRS